MTRKYRKKWLRWHKQYEKYAEKQLMDLFKKWVGEINEKHITPNNYKDVVRSVINKDDIDDTFYNIYAKIGRIHSKRLGELESKDLEFIRHIIRILRLGVNRIVTVGDSFFETIINIMSRRWDDNETVAEAAAEIEKAINQKAFYRWQAKRIARTEATAAANYATYMSGQNAGFEVEKIWISSQDERTRRFPEDEYDHFHMNNVKVDLNTPFKVRDANGRFDELLYPGDPSGEAGNVINCRCAISVIPKRDKEGNLIRT